jgi:hypothetical protein
MYKVSEMGMSKDLKSTGLKFVEGRELYEMMSGR